MTRTSPRKKAPGSPSASQAQILSAQLLLAKVSASKLKDKKKKTAIKKAAASQTATKKTPVDEPDATVKRKRIPTEKQTALVQSEARSDDEEPPAKKKMKRVSIPWAKPHMHFMSDMLLGLIEGNTTWKVAFGFDKGTSDPVATGGKTSIAHCADIAKRLFSAQAGPWEGMSDAALATVVKNRITALKTMYTECRNTMTATGMGLVEENRTDEIVTGSELGNIWDKIKKRCPWYKRLHDLMGTSPVIKQGAISHSSTDLNLSSIIHGKEAEPRQEPSQEGSVDGKGDDSEGASDKDSDTESQPHGQSPAWDIESRKPLGSDLDEDSHQGSPGLDSPQQGGSQGPKGKVSAASTAGSAPSKRKSAIEKAFDITTADREARVRLAKKSIQGRSERERIKVRGNIEIEKVRAKVEMEKIKRQQDHELRMLRLKLSVQHPSKGLNGAGSLFPDSPTRTSSVNTHPTSLFHSGPSRLSSGSNSSATNYAELPGMDDHLADTLGFDPLVDYSTLGVFPELPGDPSG